MHESLSYFYFSPVSKYTIGYGNVKKRHTTQIIIYQYVRIDIGMKDAYCI